MRVLIVVTCGVGEGDILVMRGVKGAGGCDGWGGGVLMYEGYEGTFW